MVFLPPEDNIDFGLDLSVFADEKLATLKAKIDKNIRVLESTSWVEDLKGRFVSFQEMLYQKNASLESAENKWFASYTDDGSIFLSPFNGFIDLSKMLFYHDGYCWLCIGKTRNPKNKDSMVNLRDVELYGWKIPLSKSLEIHFGSHFWYSPKITHPPFVDYRVNGALYSNIPWDSRIRFYASTRRGSSSGISHDTDNSEEAVMDLSYDTSFYMPKLEADTQKIVKAFYNENTTQEERLELLKSLPLFAQITDEDGFIDVSASQWIKGSQYGDEAGQKITSQELYEALKRDFFKATKNCHLFLPQNPLGVVQYQGVLNYEVI